MGPYIEKYRAAAEAGEDIPDEVINGPLLPDHLWEVWTAWNRLSGDRQMGATVPGRIHWVAMDRWATRYGFEGADFERLVHLLSAMDTVYLKHVGDSVSRNGSPGSV